MDGLRSRLAELDALLLTASIWFLAKFLRYAFPTLFPTFRETYHVSDATLGAAFTGMMFVYAAMQFPAGALADRLGATRVVVGGGLVASSAALLLAAEGPFALVVVGMILVGAGTGVHKTVAVWLLSGIYPERTGRALGVLDTFGTFGGVAAPTGVVLVVGTLGWRALFLAGGVVGVALTVAFASRIDGTGGDWDRGTVSFRRYLGTFAEPRLGGFLLGTVAFAFTYNGAVAFLPLYLADAGGLTEGTANLLYGAFFAVSLVQLVSGNVSDRVGPLRVIVGSIGVASLGLLGLVFGSGIVVLAGAVAVFGLGSHAFRPVRGAYLMQILPSSVAGGGFGAFRTILMAAGAVAPAIVGGVSSFTSRRVAFGLLAASLLVGLLLFVTLAVLEESSVE